MSTDYRKKEIRRLLLGYFTYDEDNNLMAAERGFRLRSLGLLNGTAGARILGVGVRRRSYDYSEELEPILETCMAAFSQIGRRVILDEGAEIPAVFYSPYFFNPSVLTAEEEEGRVVVSVYTARSIAIIWNAAHAFRQWRRHMPDGLREKDLSKEQAEEKKASRKQKKKEKRAGRKLPFGRAAAEETAEQEDARTEAEDLLREETDLASEMTEQETQVFAEEAEYAQASENPAEPEFSEYPEDSDPDEGSEYIEEPIMEEAPDEIFYPESDTDGQDIEITETEENR